MDIPRDSADELVRKAYHAVPLKVLPDKGGKDRDRDSSRDRDGDEMGMGTLAGAGKGTGQGPRKVKPETASSGASPEGFASWGRRNRAERGRCNSITLGPRGPRVMHFGVAAFWKGPHPSMSHHRYES